MKKFISFLMYIIDFRKVKKLLLLAVIFVLSIVVACRWQYKNDQIKWEEEKQQLIEAHEKELEETTLAIYKSFDSTEEYVFESEIIAKLIQNTIPNHPKESKVALCGLIFNRTEHIQYPDTIEEVVKQPGQFDTYSDDAVITEENYEIAHAEVVKFYSGGYRVIPPNFIFMTYDGDSITLRDNFDVKKAHFCEY